MFKFLGILHIIFRKSQNSLDTYRKIIEGISLDRLDTLNHYYNNPNFISFELFGEIELLYESEKQRRPIKITVSHDKEAYGHIMIEFTKKKSEFNRYFLGTSKEAKSNRNLLFEAIKNLHWEKLKYKTSLIRRINVGFDSYPFEKVRKAFYIWRMKEKDAFKDIMDYRNQIRREYNKRRRKFEKLSVEEKLRLKDMKRKLLNVYSIYYIPRKELDDLTLNLVLEYNKLIDDYIEEKAILERGSYQLYNIELLEPVLLDINVKINRVYENKLPTRELINEKLKLGILEEFKRDKNYFRDLMERGRKLEKDLDVLFKKASGEILNLEENWDNAGAKPYKLKTLERTRAFLDLLLFSFLDLCDIRLDFPKIQPGLEGDIDLEWRLKKFRLLISIPEDIEEKAGAYGDNYGESKIKINFNPEKLNSELLLWLRKQYGALEY